MLWHNYLMKKEMFDHVFVKYYNFPTKMQFNIGLKEEPMFGTRQDYLRSIRVATGLHIIIPACYKI